MYVHFTKKERKIEDYVNVIEKGASWAKIKFKFYKKNNFPPPNTMLKYFRKRNLIVVPSNFIICALKRKNIALNPLSSSFYQSFQATVIHFLPGVQPYSLRILILQMFYHTKPCLLYCAKSLQSCPTLCNPMVCSSPGCLSMGFSRQEYCSGLPCPPPGHLPNTRIESPSPLSPALASRFVTTSTT